MTGTGTRFTRRAVLGGTVALTAALAGCSGGGSESGASTPDFDGYLSDTSNYEGVIEQTDTQEVTVTVGAEANGGNFGYGPAAIRVSTGTTVVWEWNGQGNFHNVVADDGSFESEQKQEAGYTFSHTFEEPGTTKYYCTPHDSLGMKGVVVVEE